jgi:hypothetical protein
VLQVQVQPLPALALRLQLSQQHLLGYQQQQWLQCLQ